VTTEASPEPPRRGSGGFVASVATLSGGALASQLVGVMVSPLVTRLFAPEAFGVAAVFASVVGVLAPIACLKYEQAIVLPREEERAANLFGLSWGLVLAGGLLLTLASWAFGDLLLARLGASELGPLHWLIPVSFLLLGAALPLRFWSIRKARFALLAAAEFGQASLTAVATVGVGLLGFVAGGDLVLARVAAQAVQPVVLLSFLARRDVPFIRSALARREMQAAAARFQDFPRYTTWVNLLNFASRNLPTVLLAAYFDPAVAGFFALARRIVLLPSSLVGMATGQALLQRSAEIRNAGGDISKLLGDVIQRLVAVGVYPMAVLAAVGPSLFRLVFGPDWSEAGLYASVLAPWVMVMFVGAPLSVLWSVLERQRAALGYNIALLAGRVAALVGGSILTRDPVITLVLFAAVGIVFNVGMILFFARTTGLRLRGLVRSSSLSVLVAGLCAAPLEVAPFGGDSEAVKAGMAAVGAVGYAVFLWYSDAEIRGLVTRVLRRFQRSD